MISDPLSLSGFYRKFYGPMKHLGRSAATIEDYQYGLLKWERLAGKPLKEIQPRDVAAFMAVVAETRTPATVNHYRRLVLAVINYAREQELTHPAWDRASAKVPKMVEPKDDPEAYLIEELELLVKAAQRFRPRQRVEGILCRRWWPAKILTMFSTGVRVSALMSARFEDLDFEGRTLVIRGATQKNNKGRRYKLIPEAVCALREMGEKKKRDLVFPWSHDRGNRQWPTLTRHFREIIDTAGLKQPDHPFHKIRRSCASYTAAKGGKVLAQQQMGHASLSTTEVYFDPRIVETQQAADVLPPLAVKFKKG